MERIDGPAVLAYFKIQDRRPVSTLTFSHVCDHLAHGNFLAVVHEHLAIVGVRGQQTVGVLDDDQISVATQTASGVDHAAGTRGAHVLTQSP